MSYLVTTYENVYLADLGIRPLIHPVVDLDLLDYGLEPEIIMSSVDLKNAVKYVKLKLVIDGIEVKPEQAEALIASEVKGTVSLPFMTRASCRNRWLQVPDIACNSKYSPHIVPFTSKVLSLTFTNKYDDFSPTFDIYQIRGNEEPNGLYWEDSTSKVLLYSWVLGECKSGIIDNIPIIVDKGTLLAVYCKCDYNYGYGVNFNIYLGMV